MCETQRIDLYEEEVGLWNKVHKNIIHFTLCGSVLLLASYIEQDK